MSTRARKERKRAGVPFTKPAKVPTYPPPPPLPPSNWATATAKEILADLRRYMRRKI